jgi:nitrogen fixation protein FixH
MRSVRVILIAMFFLGALVASHAEVSPFNKLNVNERLALEESERRLAVYDQELSALDRQRSKGRISQAYYETETQQLTLVIREETLYQNAIIVHDPQLAHKAKDLFETIQHVAVAVPVYIGIGAAYVVGMCPGLLGMIH